MKKQAFTFLTILTLVVTFGLTSAFAERPEHLTVNIPFDFVVGSRTLPAGEYTIKQLFTRRVMIRSADGRTIAMPTTNPRQANSMHTDAKLIFNRYEGRYFLSRIITPGTDLSQELIASSVEVKIAKSGAARETVSISGTRK